jgi:hypothetical protein
MRYVTLVDGPHESFSKDHKGNFNKRLNFFNWIHTENILLTLKEFNY